MTSEAPIDAGLIEFATAKQAEKLNAWITLGTAQLAADSLGVGRTAVANAAAQVRKKAAARGYSPAHDLTRSVPETHYLKGASTLYDADGKVKLQWVKSNANLEEISSAMCAFVEALAEDIRGTSPIIPLEAPADNEANATHYKIGDQHLGLYAWGQETGDEDYDLNKSTADVLGGLRHLIASAPATKTGVLVNVGDFLHANDRKALTPASGNALDVDGRHGKVFRRAAFILREAVRMMLAKHETVEIINARGNHDPDAAVALQLVLEAYFENQPRVLVPRNDCKVLAWQFGRTVVFVTHGEKNRQHQANFITSRYREAIGKATHAYVDNGHVHHKQREELGPLNFEVWNAITATDLYHADNLYGASRSITSVIYNKHFGEVARNVCDLRMIREGAVT